MNATKQFFSDILNHHRDKLWWLHSSYSLLLGIGVMWLGAKNFAYLRLAVFHIAFIWLSGGRKNEFRIWTFRTLRNIGSSSLLRVDVRTEAGQLIGRCRLHGGKGSTAILPRN